MQLSMFKNSNNNNSLDQYYTKKYIANICVNKMKNILNNFIDIKEYLFFEPSAGYGCFYDSIKNHKLSIIGFDIEPKHKSIEKLNFLNNYSLSEVLNRIENKNIIVIGNPPFGKKSKLAIDFFNQSSNFAKTICFIIPNQFKKWTVQNKLNSEYKLISEIKLPKNAFYTKNKNNYNVNCVFQIWTKLKTKYKNKRIITKPKTTHKDFIMYQYNNTKESLKVFNNKFDIAIFSQGYGDYKTFITNKEEFNYKKQYILFKCKNKNIIKNIKNIDFEKLSTENTTIPGFRKNNIIKEYTKLYGE